MKVTIVYSEPEEIQSYNFPEGLDLVLLDENSTKTRRKAKAIKGHYAATQTPCCFLHNDKDEVIKVFYKEALDDPIRECLNYLYE